MNTNYPELFEPLKVGNLELKNRTAMAPMGLVGYADTHGGFNEEAQDYYIERAKGDVGLIFTGICAVNYNEIMDLGLPCPTHNPLMFNMSTAPMNEKIHAHGAKIFLQLTGGLGRSAIPHLVKDNYAPSEATNRFDPSIDHREITIEEIEELVQDFIDSAVVAKDAGFDGVEIHAVHEGYLLDQFAMECFNQRTDKYGGSLENRLRISTDIVKGIKEACGEDFTVSMRFSVKSFMKGLRSGALPGEDFEEFGKDYAEGIESAKILEEAGYDMLNVDAGTYDSWYWNHPPMYFEKGMYREFGKMVRDAVDVPIVISGRMEDPEMAVEALGEDCDIVAYGRPLLSDPYLVEKIRTGNLEDIRPCLACHDGCMGRIAEGLPLSCAVNPACGREVKYGIEPANKSKKVLVVGGGVGGMETARVAQTRGHDVTLVEASNNLGGNLIPGGAPDFKSDDIALIEWYENQLEKLDVEVVMNTKVDKDYIKNAGADFVVIATGATPIEPDFGNDNNIVVATDALLEKKEVGEDVVVIGGGLVGCETALWLAQQGKNVSVVEMLSDILGGPHGMPMMNYSMLKDLLEFHDVDVLTSTEVKSVKEDSVEVSNDEGIKNIDADTVIVAVGYAEDDSLYNEVKDIDVPVFNIGDSREVSNIMDAVWNGYEVGRSI